MERGKAITFVLFVIIAVIFLPVTLTDTIAALRSEKDFNKGLVEWNSGKYKATLSLMEQAHRTNQQVLAVHPENLHVRLNLSQVLLEEGQIEEGCQNLSIFFLSRRKSLFFEEHKAFVETAERKAASKFDKKNMPNYCQDVIQLVEKESIKPDYNGFWGVHF